MLNKYFLLWSLILIQENTFFKNPTAGLCPGNVVLRLNRWNTNTMGGKNNKLLSHRVQVSNIIGFHKYCIYL